MRIRPRLTEAHYLLGKAYENIDKDKSLRYYQYFRRQASADPEFLARLNEVKQRIGMLQAPQTPANVVSPANAAQPANQVKE